MYNIIDTKTGANVGKPYKTRRTAQRRADKLDNEYGAVRYVVREVEPARIPCTGGNDRFPVVDRNGVRICVGDTLRVKHCVGPYGQTRTSEMTVTEAHWQYCQHGVAATRFDFQTNTLRCASVHNDFEHGHETWAEIIKRAGE